MGEGFTLNRDVLVEALTVVNSAVEKKGTIPVLSFLLLEGTRDQDLRITGTDLDVAISLTVEAGCSEGTAFCVPAAQLREAARLSEGVVSITENGKRAEVKSDGFEVKLPVLEPSSYPECPKLEGLGIKIDGPLFARMLKMVVPAADRDDNNAKWSFNSTLVSVKDSNLRLVSAGEGQMAVATLPVGECEDVEFLLPRSSVLALSMFANSETEVEFGKTENHFGLIGSAGSVSSRLLVGKFPAWELFIPKEFSHSIKTDCESLSLNLKRAVLGLDEMSIGTRWAVTKESLFISAKSHEREGQSLLNAKCPTLNGDEVVLGLNGRMVLNFLTAVKGGLEFSFIDWERPFRFVPEAEGFEYQYITMGMKPDKY